MHTLIDLTQVKSRYIAPISKFKSNPAKVLGEANGQAVAVSSHNEVQFYAVPAHLYEEMVDIIDKHSDKRKAGRGGNK